MSKKGRIFREYIQERTSKKARRERDMTSFLRPRRLNDFWRLTFRRKFGMFGKKSEEDSCQSRTVSETDEECSSSINDDPCSPPSMQDTSCSHPQLSSCHPDAGNVGSFISRASRTFLINRRFSFGASKSCQQIREIKII